MNIIFWIIIGLIVILFIFKDFIKNIINYFIRKNAFFHDEYYEEGDYDEEPEWKKYYETNEDYRKESLGGHDDFEDMDDNPFR